MLLFLSAFRDLSVGVDTVQYLATYKSAKMSSLQAIWEDVLGKEPLYYSIEYLCSSGGLSYGSFMGIQSMLFLIPIGIGLRRDRTRPVLSLAYLILLGFFFCSLNVTRQMIATSFCFLGYVFLEDRKYFWAVLSIVLSLGFHTTAFLAIIVFALPFLNINKLWTVALLLVSFIVPVVVDLSTYLTLFANNLSVFESFMLYLDDDFNDLGRLPIYNAIRTAMFIFAAFNYKARNGQKDLIYKVALLAVIIHNLIYGVPSYVSRIVYYFDIAFIIFFVRWGNKNIIATSLSLFYAILYYFHQYIILKHDGVIPFELDF